MSHAMTVCLTSLPFVVQVVAVAVVAAVVVAVAAAAVHS